MKLVSSDDKVIFDFGSDSLGGAFLWRCVITAKFPEGVAQSEVTINPLTNDVLDALKKAAPSHDSHYERSGQPEPERPAVRNPEYVNERAAEAIAHEVFVGRIRWFELEESGRETILRDALFPLGDAETELDDLRKRLESRIEPKREELIARNQDSDQRAKAWKRLPTPSQRPSQGWSPRRATSK